MSVSQNPVEVERKITPSVAESQTDSGTEVLYTPEPSEAQLTLRALLTGLLFGGVVACMNIYMGLKIGWSFGGSLIAAILSFGVWLPSRRLSVLETNIAQTAGSAAGTMSSAAGLLAAIPAMLMLGQTIPTAGLFLWALSIAYLGVFFAVPLRRQMIEAENLRFPTGTATAETIMAMFAEAREAVRKAQVLTYALLAAGFFTLGSYFVEWLAHPPLELIPGLAVLVAWTFTLQVAPMFVGAGILIGPRVSTSLLAGAVLAWGLLGPWVQARGWAAGDPMSLTDGPRGWILWPGVAIMVSEALMALVLRWRTFVRALAPTLSTEATEAGKTDLSERIPNAWWLGGLAVASIGTALVAQRLFAIPLLMSILAVALSFILAIVAVRSVGETDINPVGGMGKVTQLVYGGIAPGNMTTNLMAAAITGAGASQAADMMQDLKTGRMLGASPRKQFLAQLVGIGAGVLFCVPAFKMLTRAYALGGDELPAPAAQAWKAVAELLTQGFDALPPRAGLAVLVAASVGGLLPILRRQPRLAPFLPSGLALGIAFMVPAYYSIVIFGGAMLLVIWRKLQPGACDRYAFALASGLIAGEGLFGLGNAALTLLQVPTLTASGGVQLAVAAAVLAVTAGLLWRGFRFRD